VWVVLRLRELPRVRAAFARGELSYSKVRAITRVAVPEIEEMLLEWADVSTAAQLEACVAGFRTARRAARRGEDDLSDDGYALELRSHGDGTMSLTLRAPAEDCLEVYAHLQRRIEVAGQPGSVPSSPAEGTGSGPEGSDGVGSEGAGPDGARRCRTRRTGASSTAGPGTSSGRCRG
jgi:hypothetical protein